MSGQRTNNGGAPETGLENTRQLLASIVESSDDAIISENLQGIITSWNSGAERIFGYAAPEAIGNPISMLYMPNNIREMEEILARIRAGERVRHYETVRRHKDGHAIAVSLSVSPVRDSSGRIVGASKIARDITETKRLIELEELVRVENRFRKLLEAAPDAIIEVDHEGRIVLLNEMAEKMFGYSRQELLGLNVEVLVPDAMRGGHKGHRASYTAHPQTRPMGSGLELKAQKKDGTLFPVEISLSPNRVDEGLHVIVLVRDITERKQAENQLKNIQEKYTSELAEKNEQLGLRNQEVERATRLKSEFLASMSHELRTPLHTIIGFSELILEEMEGPLSATHKRFVGHIFQDARHLLELINEILDLSKIEAGRLKLQHTEFDFAECVQEAITSLHQQAGSKQISLESIRGFDGVIYADRVRVKEILYNLLSNAIKFTPQGGRVWVESAPDGDFLQATVGDTGIGIAQEEQAAIFEDFYQAGETTRGVREGTGLGLPITKKLIELHGGRIWLESRPGNGSRFSFRLPLTQITGL